MTRFIEEGNAQNIGELAAGMNPHDALRFFGAAPLSNGYVLYGGQRDNGFEDYEYTYGIATSADADTGIRLRSYQDNPDADVTLSAEWPTTAFFSTYLEGINTFYQTGAAAPEVRFPLLRGLIYDRAERRHHSFDFSSPLTEEQVAEVIQQGSYNLAEVQDRLNVHGPMGVFDQPDLARVRLSTSFACVEDRSKCGDAINAAFSATSTAPEHAKAFEEALDVAMSDKLNSKQEFTGLVSLPDLSWQDRTMKPPSMDALRAQIQGLIETI